MNKKIDSNGIIDRLLDKAKETVDDIIEEVNGIAVRKLNVKKLSGTAVIPTRNDGDAGFDLYADENKVIQHGVQTLVSTSIALEIPEGYVGLIWPRSGLSAKNGIDILAGVVDSSYRGEVKVCLLYNGLKSYTKQDDELLASDERITGVRKQKIKKGDKIAQILIQEVPPFKMVEAEVLSDTTRGDKGFGSSGR